MIKKNLHILVCLEQTALLDTVKQELPFLGSHFHLKYVSVTKEAEEYLNSILDEEASMSLLICSNAFSGTDGVDLVVRLHENSHTTDARKILVCENLDSEKILRALNHGGLDYCQLAPWQTVDFAKIVIKILSEYVVRFAEHPLPYAFVLVEGIILHHLRNQNPPHLDFR
ncbi:MAG: hypothetical protein VXY89_10425 [SAR324 cluster bacterium]|nr:hypothetical protein [SAR324 cluster bacterium]